MFAGLCSNSGAQRGIFTEDSAGFLSVPHLVPAAVIYNDALFLEQVSILSGSYKEGPKSLVPWLFSAQNNPQRGIWGGGQIVLPYNSIRAAAE